ncbi:hypothetical protein DLJ54_04280 [Corynebacterium heidelbergense]|uniref:Uncharacterized protein n=1 Tax=Corynebacterium heidelbergense TaxID=2055947 RepID=A0A364V6E1_9CORY|nr:hypothetical protein DLJ54_04280 [Corynebacterium heidelbergense]
MARFPLVLPGVSACLVLFMLVGLLPKWVTASASETQETIGNRTTYGAQCSFNAFGKYDCELTRTIISNRPWDSKQPSIDTQNFGFSQDHVAILFLLSIALLVGATILLLTNLRRWAPLPMALSGLLLAMNAVSALSVDIFQDFSAYLTEHGGRAAETTLPDEYTNGPTFIVFAMIAVAVMILVWAAFCGLAQGLPMRQAAPKSQRAGSMAPSASAQWGSSSTHSGFGTPPHQQSARQQRVQQPGARHRRSEQ